MAKVRIGVAMSLDQITSARESHTPDDAAARPQTISLLSFLKAENVKLRQAVVELSFNAMALREALKRFEARL